MCRACQNQAQKGQGEKMKLYSRNNFDGSDGEYDLEISGVKLVTGEHGESLLWFLTVRDEDGKDLGTVTHFTGSVISNHKNARIRYLIQAVSGDPERLKTLDTDLMLGRLCRGTVESDGDYMRITRFVLPNEKPKKGKKTSAKKNTNIDDDVPF